MKNVLVIYYSQSGQLKEIIDNIIKPFDKQDITTDFLQIQMKNDFPVG